jgi:hypothetical protein
MKAKSKTKNSSKKNILGHVHIERTGGTTLSQILRRIFPLQFGQAVSFCSQQQGIFRPEDLTVLLKINPIIKCISGHTLRPYIDLTEIANLRYITVLRDPINRYISHHLYWAERQGWEHTFEHFMNRDDMFNFQTKIIAGKEDLNLAKKILRTKFFCVGILEKFEDFLVLLSRKFQTRQRLISGYKLKNPGKKNSIRKKNILENFNTYREKIIERNRIDIQLYEYVINELHPIQDKEFANSEDNHIFRLGITNPGFKQDVAYYLEKLFAAFYYVPVTRLAKKLMRTSES